MVTFRDPGISIAPQGPLTGPGAGLGGGNPIVGLGAQSPTGPLLSPRAAPPLGPAGALGPRIVQVGTPDPTTTGSTGGGALGEGTGLPTLDALLARQEELSGKGVQMGEMISPWQGASYALQKGLEGFQEGKNQRDILAQEAARGDILRSIGEGGMTMEHVAAMSEVDPAFAAEMYKTVTDTKGTKQWDPIPTPEGENGQWFRDRQTGETKKVGGGSPGEGGWKPSDLGSLRDDYTKAASTYESAAPSWQSIKEAATISLDPNADVSGKGAADYNMIVGFAKLLDPNSVVREGEVKSASMTGGTLDMVNGWLNNLKGEGVLADDVRKAIMEQANSRMKAYYDQAATKREWITGIATRHNIDPNDIVPPLPAFQPWVLPGAEEAEPEIVED